MPVPFIMPKFDMDQEKATIASWLKKEGDYVKADETVLVVETEKVAIDVPAPASGILAGICHQNGDTVPVTTVIAYILKEGETLAVPATPVAMRMAQQEGIDLARVPLTGKKITRDDVESYLASRAANPVTPGRVLTPATPAARRLAREKGARLEDIQGSGPNGRVQAADVTAFAQQPPSTPVSPARPAQIVPLTNMRRKIAERMTASAHDIPHIILSVEVNAVALETCLQNLNKIAARNGAGKISLTAVLVKIVSWALRRNPYLNASWSDEKIFLWEDANIGIATAIPDGLIVPVIQKTQQKSIHEIAGAIQDLTARAKDGRLGLNEVRDGTFTISNLGMFGIQQFQAIINPPECAILAVGALVRKPVVINDRDDVAVRPVINLTLSADHRLIDGVIAARFLQDLVQGIEIPESLLY